MDKIRVKKKNPPCTWRCLHPRASQTVLRISANFENLRRRSAETSVCGLRAAPGAWRMDPRVQQKAIWTDGWRDERTDRWMEEWWKPDRDDEWADDGRCRPPPPAQKGELTAAGAGAMTTQSWQRCRGRCRAAHVWPQFQYGNVAHVSGIPLFVFFQVALGFSALLKIEQKPRSVHSGEKNPTSGKITSFFLQFNYVFSLHILLQFGIFRLLSEIPPCAKGPNTDLHKIPKVLERGEKTNRSPSSPPPSNLLSIPNSPLAVSPASHRSVVAVSLCGGEACMCILTRAVLPSPLTTTTTTTSPNTEHRLPGAVDSS